MRVQFLNHGLLALCLGLVASAHPLDTPASDVANTVNTPAAVQAVTPLRLDEVASIPVSSSAGLQTRDNIVNFVSPHRRRQLTVFLANGSILTAKWAFNVWLQGKDDYFTLWNSAVSSPFLNQCHLKISDLHTLMEQTGDWTGLATFTLSGLQKGTELIVSFAATVYGSADDFYFKEMVQEPTAKEGDVSIPVKSWTLGPA
ncbi:hypothetical protein E4U41_000705 [Claviceps citrina]|nr:hypothetical protein E4U41_000705 [Claviceps citrina]